MRYFFLIAISSSFFTVFGQRTDSTTVVDSAVSDSSKTYIVAINRILQTAESQLGTPYRWGGKSPGGFDCSGFVLWCYATVCGIKLPANGAEYTHYGVPVSKKEARPGDVICFTGYNARNRSIGHVGIITEVTPTEIHFIHSASHGGIRHDVLSQAYYRTRFLGIRRILN